MKNEVRMRGTVIEGPKMVEMEGNQFQEVVILIPRLSGLSDQLIVALKDDVKVETGDEISLIGELRSLRYEDETGRSHLKIYVVANKVYDSVEVLEIGTNEVSFDGKFSRVGELRITPQSNRRIVDISFRVPRKEASGKIRADYIPMIAWEKKAENVVMAKKNQDGDPNLSFHVVGRFQSRSYIKRINDVPVEKTAYEVSIADFSYRRKKKREDNAA